MAAARPIRMRYLPPRGDFTPIATINTTPLIDVMLVLLIMFIIVIPAASHKVPLDLPPPPPDVPVAPQPFHRIDIGASGALSWDGAALSAEALPGRLAAMAADPARPVLHLGAASEARYERVDQILAVIARSGVTRLGLVDNRQFASAF